MKLIEEAFHAFKLREKNAVGSDFRGRGKGVLRIGARSGIKGGYGLGRIESYIMDLDLIDLALEVIAPTLAGDHMETEENGNKLPPLPIYVTCLGRATYE